jgi:hypothetical protein
LKSRVRLGQELVRPNGKEEKEEKDLRLDRKTRCGGKRKNGLIEHFKVPQPNMIALPLRLVCFCATILNAPWSGFHLFVGPEVSTTVFSENIVVKGYCCRASQTSQCPQLWNSGAPRNLEILG